MTEEDLILYKFLGILFGVAVRTKKPLDLHLAPLVWKQLVGIPLSPDDIEEVRNAIPHSFLTVSLYRYNFYD